MGIGSRTTSPQTFIRTVYFFWRVAKVPLKEVHGADVWGFGSLPLQQGWLTTTACQQRMPIFSAVDEESEDLREKEFGGDKGKERKGKDR